MRIATVLALGMFAAMAYACGGTSSLGSGGENLNKGGSGGGGATGGNGGSGGSTGGSGGGAQDPCAGKPCGATCNDCPPGQACAAVLTYCDSSGSCGMNYPICDRPGQCTTDSDCPQMGAPCQQCPDGSFACPSVQCLSGECVGSFEGCAGSTCQSDADCPQVGAPCEQCPDGSINCPWSICDSGICVSGGFDGCTGYDPCAGKACGDACSLCNDPSCAETAVLKYCDPAGHCTTTPPRCEGGSTCTTKADCPAVGACPYCPGGSCAELDCVNGACEFVCPPAADPQCTTDSDCQPSILICKLCSDATCAAMSCVNGACDWVCR
jgi:hypothetical protein